MHHWYKQNWDIPRQLALRLVFMIAQMSLAILLQRHWQLNILGRFLFDLFCGVLGRGVRREPGGIGWNQIVHDLLNDTAKRSVTRQSAKIVHRSRISDPAAALAAIDSNPNLRFIVGDVDALYSSAGYSIEIPDAFEQLAVTEDRSPPTDRRPLDRGDEGQRDSITTIIVRFSGQE
jgi:hypothetical protein